jgi:hypothetical protein
MTINDFFFYELSAYKTEIVNLQNEIKNFTANPEVENLTAFSLGVSNRSNLMVVGLCSLIEVYLYEIAINKQDENSFKIDDLKGNGLARLQLYLTRSGNIDFGKISQWSNFKDIYVLRNALVHSYGGYVETEFISKVEKAVKKLKIESALVANRRIRLTPEILLAFHKVIESVVDDLRKFPCVTNT